MLSNGNLNTSVLREYPESGSGGQYTIVPVYAVLKIPVSTSNTTKAVWRLGLVVVAMKDFFSVYFGVGGIKYIFFFAQESLKKNLEPYLNVKCVKAKLNRR